MTVGTFRERVAQLGEMLGWKPELPEPKAAHATPVVAVDEVHPCPRCGHRCDFQVCRCDAGCPGDGDHLRKLRKGHGA